MNPTDEIAALRNELSLLRKDTDSLRRELDDLRRFISVDHDEDGKATDIIIRCAALFLSRSDTADRHQVFIAAGPGDSGPCISMLGTDGIPRILLTLEKDDPRIVLRGPGGTDAVLLHAHPATGCGMVAVLDNGKPRALIRATDDDAGVISAVHDDGKPRVCIRSTGEHGEIFVTTHDSETAIKLTTKSLGGGGTLTVHGHGGKPAVILGTIGGYGGCIILNDPEGIPYITLPDPKTDHGEDAAEE